MMKKIKISNTAVSQDGKCFIISEAGVNHNGKLSIARKLVNAAKDSGCDAIKFQTFVAENLATKNAEMADYQKKNTGKKEKQQTMLKKLELPYVDFIKLKKYCDEKRITFLSTPYTEDAVDFLNPILPAFKISSADLTNIPMLQRVAKKGKPIILGTGMSTIDEVKEAIKTIKQEGNTKIILLHCTTNYPCSLDEVNLNAMETIAKETGCLVGYSDHTIGLQVPIMAVTAGATVIEKHLTLSRKLKGPDHKSSIEPEELKEMVRQIRLITVIKGSPEKKPTKSEKKIMRVVRKSIVAVEDIRKRDLITQKKIAIKRPATGIAPKYLNKILGKVAVKEINKDDTILWSDIK